MAFDITQAKSGSEVWGGCIPIRSRGPCMSLSNDSGETNGTFISNNRRGLINSYKESKSNLLDRSEIGEIIRDIQQLKHFFQQINFISIPRTANFITHTWAMETIRRRIHTYLEGGVPDFVAQATRLQRQREPD
ncbi:hypothetical protein PVK06_008052 [Gossypium arboreum]|uniref:RNase H type-1 domain-containing protein n=1 Tax=Gossypium arboreum TaxID=29729 RepID=A0ABR0QIZ8_GOSAR|nr:hypothetical protein PVK06_008052 [Gossypium arboreum]